MLGTRYEEHIGLWKSLPFKFISDIVITPQIYSREANWHENLELQLYTFGKGTVMLNEKFIPIEKGDLIVVNSTMLHHTSSPKCLKCDCLIIDTEFCKAVNIDPRCKNFEHKIKSKSLTHMLKRLRTLYEDESEHCREAKLVGIILEILVELSTKHIVSQNAQSMRNSDFDEVKNAIRFIKENYQRKFSVEEISKNVFLNPRSLSRKFKKVTGQTIVDYINSYRCKKALDYILEGNPVSDAARMSGFTNMSFFTRVFKEIMGCLPSEYKSKNK